MRGHPPSAAAAPLLRRTGRQAFPTPRGDGKSDPKGRNRDRNGGLPRLADGVAHASRCPASPRRTLKAENLGKPARRVMISAPWYKAGQPAPARPPASPPVPAPAGAKAQ